MAEKEEEEEAASGVCYLPSVRPSHRLPVKVPFGGVSSTFFLKLTLASTSAKAPPQPAGSPSETPQRRTGENRLRGYADKAPLEQASQPGRTAAFLTASLPLVSPPRAGPKSFFLFFFYSFYFGSDTRGMSGDVGTHPPACPRPLQTGYAHEEQRPTFKLGDEELGGSPSSKLLITKINS